MNTADSAPGFFGKVASRGDFVSRRLPPAFVDRWDQWLQDGMACSREQLGDNWLDHYLTSPVWHFTLAPGICGEESWAGVMIPGVDRVGRYFPFTLAARPPPGCNPIKLLFDSDQWFAKATELAVATLEDAFDLEDLDRALVDLGIPPGEALRAEPAQAMPARPGGQLCLDLPTGRADWQAVSGELLNNLLPRHCAWRTEGSDHVKPCLLICPDLPKVGGFAALMDGRWEERGWQTPVSRPPAGAQPEAQTDSSAGMHWNSSAASRQGHSHKVNQDAFLEDPGRRIWAVADGMGGHSHGELASRSVVKALARLPKQGSLRERVRRAQTLLQEVNGALYRRGRELGTVIGSTCVVLLAEDNRCVCLWAGDSRAYMLRDGRIRPLTRDHSLANEGPATTSGPIQSNVITRAVGGAETLDLEISTFRTQPGDRLLLCSDGLGKGVTDDQIVQVSDSTSMAELPAKLANMAVAGGSRDDVTVIVARFSEDKQES